MALPDYTNYYGLALIRRYVPTGEEWHITWLNPVSDFYVDHPGIGNWEWRIIAVMGASATMSTVYNAYPTGHSNNGKGIQMALLQTKK